MKKKKNNVLNILKYDNTNLLYIEKIYQRFLKNPNSLSSYWNIFFKKNNHNYYQYNINNDNQINHILEYNIQEIIFQIILFFRENGHQYANLNPLSIYHKKKKISLSKLLKIIYHKNKKNYDLNIHNTNINNKKIFDVYHKFKNIYCTSIGIEYTHIKNITELLWIQEYIEHQRINFKLSYNKKKKILNQLIEAEIFEKYLHAKFPGAKRFSLEGCETLIPILHYIINYSVYKKSKKIIFGMAHRGRLNVLVNILKKPINQLFYEFSDNYQTSYGTGDAKYHAGVYNTRFVKNKNIILDLKPNPSHLEIINPVVMGSAKSYLESLNTKNTNYVLPINIHGDSAIIGQGINQEALNISQTNNYFVGGTLHIIINNQIGFTTSNIRNIRSSEYCTDIAKIIQVPIFHINADDPESAIFIIQLALDYRYLFKKDVFIDLICYRRRGHNEVDEPSVTQPIMYKNIIQHNTVCKIYSQYLQDQNIIDHDYFNNQKNKYREKINILSKLPIIPNIYSNNIDIQLPSNNIQNINIRNLFIKIHSLPKYFSIHNIVHKLYKNRCNMVIKNKLLDWGGAEILAYAYILHQGISCRLSGEDVGRGTFFHRHVKIYNQNNGLPYIPLHYIKKKQGTFYICDSALSEEAILAFEYGYSINSYKTINIWEAQFGDFINGAQIVIDQFICSGEQKWNIKSNLIILLPHGYEGQGPEHSSCRLERFLQLCSQNNMKIYIPSTAGQIYHALCSQAFSIVKKPLIILTPKSLLRNSLTYSSLLSITNNTFQKVIYEIDPIKINKIKKIIFCSGKIYYDLLIKRRMKKNIDVILIRIEQLYPFPKYEILKILKFYKDIKNITWCQEEPKNQGAWNYIYSQFTKLFSDNIILYYIGRPSSAAPAVGCFSIHQKQQNKIINDALNTVV